MLSQKDVKILNILEKDCKLPSKKISERTGIPITTIHNRVKRMEEDGVIKSYRAVLDKKKIGKPIQAFIHISLSNVDSASIGKKISMMPDVDECYILTGTTDILVKISTSDVDHLNSFVMGNIKPIKGVENTLISIILKEI
ncbi:MAG: Lrp/AsnC family transcriptional regulator [Candidatus Aenigmatarchaeota archaeon]